MAVVTDQLPRAARDLARKRGKDVEVTVTGAEIEIDRAILDAIAEPLLHVLAQRGGPRHRGAGGAKGGGQARARAAAHLGAPDPRAGGHRAGGRREGHGPGPAPRGGRRPRQALRRGRGPALRPRGAAPRLPSRGLHRHRRRRRQRAGRGHGRREALRRVARRRGGAGLAARPGNPGHPAPAAHRRRRPAAPGPRRRRGARPPHHQGARRGGAACQRAAALALRRSPHLRAAADPGPRPRAPAEAAGPQRLRARARGW